MVQDLFDDLNTIHLATSGEVRMYWDRWKEIEDPESLDLPAGTVSVGLRFVWLDAKYQFSAHCYLTPSGNLAKSEMIDPKSMRYGGEKLFRIS